MNNILKVIGSKLRYSKTITLIMCDSLCRCCIKGMCYSFTYLCDDLKIRCNPSSCPYNECRDAFTCINGYEYNYSSIMRFELLIVIVFGILVIGFVFANADIKWWKSKRNKVKPLMLNKKIQKTKMFNDNEQMLVTCTNDLNSNN